MLYRFNGCENFTESLNECIAGQHLRILVDGKAQRFDDKYEALIHALKKISARCPNAFGGLPVIDIYFTAEIGAEARWHPESPNGIPYLVLGDRTLFKVNKVLSGQDLVSGMGHYGPRGVADQLYDTRRIAKLSPLRWRAEFYGTYARAKQLEKAIAIIIHEFAHIIHGCRHGSKDSFWRYKRIDAPLTPYILSTQVSSYTHANNYNEFVAEVFAGCISGLKYSDTVMSLYRKCNGPLII